ncbi:ESPR-type extended signal peptide-containing protein, partial [Caballeronia sp. LZ029]|uniref:ESPR-type extended signal peptide-containing protein n=1 Tax=Caballeronia sp. LZ029 TaxID=3038564 RepID=UPI00285771E7
MNKTYKVVWSQACEKWVVVPELARTRGKSTKRSVVVAASTMATLAGGTAHAVEANSYTNGVFDSSALSNCFSSTASGPQNGADCDSGGKTGVGFVAFNQAALAGAYALAPDSYTLLFGTAGSDQFAIVTDPIAGTTTINAYAQINMNRNKITGVAAGMLSNGSLDAVNGTQLFGVSSSMSAGLSTASSRVSSLSTGLSTVNLSLESLSTSTSTGLSTVASVVTSLSTGLSTVTSNVSSLSTGVSTITSNVSSLSTGVSTVTS